MDGFDFFPEFMKKCDIYRIVESDTDLTEEDYILKYSNVDCLLVELPRYVAIMGQDRNNIRKNRLWAFRLGTDIQSGDRLVITLNNKETITLYAGQPIETLDQIEVETSSEEVV